MGRVIRCLVDYEIKVKDTLTTELTPDDELIDAIVKDFETPVKTKDFVGKGKVSKVRIGWED